MTKDKEPTTQDIIDVIQVFAGNMEKKLDSMEKNLRLEIGIARDRVLDHQKLVAVMKKSSLGSSQELKQLEQAI